MDTNETARKKIATKIGKGTKKAGKFFGALIGGGLILTSLTTKEQAPSLMPSQDNSKASITIAAASSGLPKNTLDPGAALGSTDNKDRPKSSPVDAKIGSGPDPSMAPIPKTFGEKFCDVSVKDDTVQVKIQIKEKEYMYEIQTSLFEKIGIPNASNRDIAAMAFDKVNSTIHFITKKGIISYTIDLAKLEKTDVGGSVKNNQFAAIMPVNGSEIFTDPGTYYISEDGTKIFATTPTLFIIIKPEYSNCFDWSSLGKKNPLEKPVISSETKNGKKLVIIKDPTMIKDNGKNYEVGFDMVMFEVGTFEY